MRSTAGLHLPAAEGGSLIDRAVGGRSWELGGGLASVLCSSGAKLAASQAAIHTHRPTAQRIL